MTDENKLMMLESMVGEEEESVLSTYLALAGEAIVSRAYPYAGDDEEIAVPAKYHMLQVEIAAYMLNKRGAEGQESHSENNIVRVYGSADIPDDMLSRIVPHVGVIGG